MFIYILENEKQPFKLHTQWNMDVCNQVIFLMNLAKLFVVYFTASNGKDEYKESKYMHRKNEGLF